MTAGFETIDRMAYVGSLPWHGGGTYAGKENVDGRTMQRLAGMDWTVGKRPVFYTDDAGQLRRVEGQYTMVCDDGFNIPCTVGEKYTEVQNRSENPHVPGLFDTMERMVSDSGGQMRFHTAGSLNGRRRVWALGQIAEVIDVKRREGDRDLSVVFILGSNSHDGSSDLQFGFCRTRVVCANTEAMALAEMKGRSDTFRSRHTASIRANMWTAAEVLGLAAASVQQQQQLLQGLADSPLTRESFVTLCAQLLSGEADADKAREVVAKSEGRSRALYARKGGILVDLFSNGRGNRGNSKLDALNAVSEYVDHGLDRVGKVDWDTKGASILWGAGAALKQRALALVVAA